MNTIITELLFILYFIIRHLNKESYLPASWKRRRGLAYILEDGLNLPTAGKLLTSEVAPAV